ncbi:ABC transporter substrate-binding protein [Clostridium sp.]|uniref:ABC transporter substrate-binding protein n=1 Tax=Clostridium sp. TaxID=1506 RepID=UPI003216FBB3
MKFKKLISILLVAITMISFTACGNLNSSSSDVKEATGETGGNIIVPLDNEPSIINPAFITTDEEMLVSNIVYSPLYVCSGGKIITYLAYSVDFKEDKELTIELRKDLKWHDGIQITSDDVVYTLNLILDEKQNSLLRESLLINGEPIKVEKVDKLTVKITLPTKNAGFVNNLCGISPVPKHIYEGEELVMVSEKNNTPIGSGPFKFKEWKKGESIIFERFDEYYSGNPNADMITMKIMPNKTEQEKAFKNGEIALMRGSSEFYNKSKDDENLQTYTHSGGRLNYIVFNQNTEAMKDLNFRKSIAYALDRNAMIKSAYGDESFVGAISILIPQADYYTDTKVEGYAQDLEKSKTLLKESEVSVDKIKIGYDKEAFGHKDYALVVQQQLKEIGIDTEIVNYESEVFSKILYGGGTECDLYINGYNLGLDVNAYRRMFETGSFYNKTGYSNPEVDKLWNKGFNESDGEKRKEIYRDIQLKIAEDAVIYPIDYEEILMIAQKNLKGIDKAIPKGMIMFEDWSKLYIK